MYSQSLIQALTSCVPCINIDQGLSLLKATKSNPLPQMNDVEMMSLYKQMIHYPYHQIIQWSTLLRNYKRVIRRITSLHSVIYTFVSQISSREHCNLIMQHIVISFAWYTGKWSIGMDVTRETMTTEVSDYAIQYAGWG